MKPDRWQQINELFHEALSREPEERAAFLDRACLGDDALRHEVESLLASDERAESFIEAPAFRAMAELITDDQSESLIGRSVGPYRVLSRLGAGGMGEVYLAEDARLARKVALKVLPTYFTRDEERVRRFQQEARAASALNHPSILTIHEIGGVDDLRFMVTEYIEGETLREHLRWKRMGVNEALDVAAQVASALVAAHQAGIIHRDIKPENIMVRHDGYVKVLDFGLAKPAERQATGPEALTLMRTDPGVVMGTASYMSPEQARGVKVDGRTDIWSLGVVLYEMVTSRVPFEGETSSDVIASLLTQEPNPLAKYSPEVPTELDWIMQKALRKDREERYQTAKELLTDLKNLKHRLEFEAELGRSAAPEWRGKSSQSGHMEQEIHFCTTADGVRIAYATVGDGPPLVKAANWLNHLEFDWRSPIWRHLLEEFARDHFLIRYDERGNGLSDWNARNLTFEAFVQDLESVVDATGLNRFPILGISQGGPVAIAYAVRHPEKVSRLILYGAYARGWAKRGSPSEDIERRQAQLTLIKLGWGQDNPAFRQLWTTLYVPDATPEQWRWFNDLQRISASPENAFRLLTEVGKIDVVDLLPQVKVPTLVLHCRDDAAVPFEEGRLLAALIPGARFVPLEGRNHLLLESESAWATFITEVRRFLKAGSEPPAVKQKRPGAGGKATAVRNGQARVETAREPERVSSDAARARSSSSRRKPRKAIDSLAILPLTNASSDPNMEYLSDGITESIINSLSQLPKLHVMARSTVFRYKGRGTDPQEAGRELGVRAVVAGSVRQAGDNLHVQAELVDVANGWQLWGEHYHRKLADIFEVQEEIAKEIAEKLRLKLSGEQRKQLAKRYTENTEAYQLYLKGRYFWNKRTEEGLQKGIEYFQRAIDADSNYALAYSGLADSYIMCAFYGYLAPRDAMSKAKAAVLKALEADDALAEAHISLAAIRTFYEWDWLDAERDFRRGLKLNSGCAKGHHWYACSLTAEGRFDEGIREMERAKEIEPLSLIINRDVGRHYYFLRQYDRAIEQCRKTLEMDPNFFLAYLYLVPAYEQKAMFDEAIEELQKAITLSGSSTPLIALLGHVYAVSGRSDKTQEALGELKERAKQKYVPPFYFALIYAGLGEKDQAFEWLGKAYDERSSFLVWLNVDPVFDNLRTDPRFADLLRRIGLPQ